MSVGEDIAPDAGCAQRTRIANPATGRELLFPSRCIRAKAVIGFVPKKRSSMACVGFMTCCNCAGLAGRACRGDNDNAGLSRSLTTETRMDKFLVLYRAPNSVIDEWMKKPEQERKPEETKMMDAWKKWMSENG